MSSFPILDVGCGTDTRFHAMPRGSVNCDIDKPRAKILDFVRCDARKLPFRPNTFKVALMYNILEHIINYQQALAEGLRVARKGVIVRVDGFFTLRNFATRDHVYLTLGMRFVRTPIWMRKLRSTTLNPYAKTDKRVFKAVHRIANICFRAVLRLWYLNYGRSWHYYMVSGNEFSKIRSRRIYL